MLKIRSADVSHLAATLDVLENALDEHDDVSEDMLKDARDIINELQEQEGTTDAPESDEPQPEASVEGDEAEESVLVD